MGTRSDWAATVAGAALLTGATGLIAWQQLRVTSGTQVAATALPMGFVTAGSLAAALGRLAQDGWRSRRAGRYAHGQGGGARTPWRQARKHRFFVLTLAPPRERQSPALLRRHRARDGDGPAPAHLHRRARIQADDAAGVRNPGRGR